MFGFFKKKEEVVKYKKVQYQEDYIDIEPIAKYFHNETGITFDKQVSILKSKVTSFCKRRYIHSFAKLLDDIKSNFTHNNTLILKAPPGAGKSTVVPISLLEEFWLEDKIIIMLEPRRVAARMVAQQMARLLNEEIDLCSLIAEIPSSLDYPCLNLSQSVLIFCYEIFKNIDFMQEPNIYGTISVDEMENFYDKLEKLLLDIDFLDKNNPNFKMKAIRKIFGRCFLTKNEVNLLYGIIRQVRNLEHIFKRKMEN